MHRVWGKLGKGLRIVRFFSVRTYIIDDECFHSAIFLRNQSYGNFNLK